MKRLFLLILAAAMLSSCGSAPSASPKSSGDSPAEAPPKNVSYLADKAFDTDEFLPDYDAELTYTSFYGGFCETDDAFYFTRGDENGFGYFIWYYDKASGISGKLCPRPECTHSDSTCNAYISTPTNALSAYDGGLICYDYDHYGGKDKILSINPDGSGRRELRSDNSVEFDSYPNQFFHRGYKYVFRKIDTITLGQVRSTLSFTAEPIGNGDGFEIINEEADGLGGIMAVPFRNDVYILLTQMPQESSVGTMKVCRFDSKTRELETVYEGETDCEGITDQTTRIRTDGEKLWISGGGDKTWQLMTLDLKAKELSKKEITGFGYKLLMPGGEPVLTLNSSEGSTTTGITVYDLEMNPLYELALDLKALGLSGFAEVIGMNEDLIVLSNGTQTTLTYIAVPLDGSAPYHLCDPPQKQTLTPPKKEH